MNPDSQQKDAFAAHAQPQRGPLPMTRAEMDRLGWDALDVLLISGDAYVDHPAFGVALLGRWLAAHGYRVGIVAQPRWDRADDFMALGRPRLFAGIAAGALDSMLAHYTAFRKKRSDDAYTPGGKCGARPNRATIVYTSLVRHAFPGLPVIIGGIEASLRRVTHYDFWLDAVRRPLLLDSKVDLLVYGMGERAILDVAQRLNEGGPLHGIRGTAFVSKPSLFMIPEDAAVVRLPSHEAIAADPRQLMIATLALEQQVHGGEAWAVQSVGNREVVCAPPARPLAMEELDAVYALPFTRRAHPSYKQAIPALEMIQFSITAHRGCAGGCSFCSLALHQGRRIQSRSATSIIAEVRQLAAHPDWKGSVTDIGGPSANMWGATCDKDAAGCRRASCLYPRRCNHFKADQKALAKMLDAVARVPGVNHVRVASGVRHDLAIAAPDYVHALLTQFAGGQLKLAPEHSCDRVLQLMRKPAFDSFLQFLALFERETRLIGKKQYVIPYLMSAFPGCTDDDMHKLAHWLKTQGWRPQQVQCFIPTPGTVATAMFHAGIDPEGKPIPVAKTDAERMRQHYILAPKPHQATISRRKTRHANPQE